MTTSINKMRNIVNWADYQAEYFNDKFKSISDIEKAFDYCVKNDIEFLDDQMMNKLEEEEYDKVVKEVKELLGYSVF
jgi:hypothetical protein